MIKNEKIMFAKVSESENDEIIEIPIEPPGYILMSTLTAQFPGACGLKFKTTEQLWRGYVNRLLDIRLKINAKKLYLFRVRVVDDKLYPPDDKWDSNVYIITYPKGSKTK
jgi:TAR DNA-binding protein 43